MCRVTFGSRRTGYLYLNNLYIVSEARTEIVTKLEDAKCDVDTTLIY